MKTHFIGMGERIMGDLAAALCQQGHQVTGSDVSFTKHALHGLESVALVPEQPGWFTQKITQSLDKVVVGRRVSSDNPELQAAQQLGLPIYSYPEYIYDYAQDKQRIVIIGGKETTLICVLVLHVLAFLHKAFDYVVDAAALKASVRLSDAPIIILEGDVEPSSSIDSQPHSLHYQHHMALISGIGWESSSTYPTLDTYLKQLKKLADASPKGSTLIYHEEDNLVKAIGNQARTDVKRVPYKAHAHRYKDDQVYLITPQGTVPFQEKDAASMCALAGAQQLLHNLAISDQQFYEALATFSTN
jgi:UDP-N-acetylmuramate: L-alanyl-gamma-D-glutamyl-meso-diaminopimelate ligase